LTTCDDIELHATFIDNALKLLNAVQNCNNIHAASQQPSADDENATAFAKLLRELVVPALPRVVSLRIQSNRILILLATVVYSLFFFFLIGIGNESPPTIS
jgi:hypothetical protein